MYRRHPPCTPDNCTHGVCVANFIITVKGSHFAQAMKEPDPKPRFRYGLCLVIFHEPASVMPSVTWARMV